MADDGLLDEGTETAALNEVLAAEHAAVWGYGTVGAALPGDARGPAVAGDVAHRDARDRLVALLESRGAVPVPREAGYTLPFPVLSAVDAAALAVVLEEGVSAAWVRLLDRSAEPSVREFAVGELGAAEVRAVGWRASAGRIPVTDAFPGFPEG